MGPITAESSWITMTIYGDSGSGKTTLAAMAPKPLFLNRDNGLMTLLHRPQLAGVRKEDIRTVKDLDRSLANLSGTGKKDWSKFRTVILDDLPSIQSMVVQEIMARVLERDDRRDPDDLSIKEYGTMGNRMRRYIRRFKDLPMHKIFVCSMGAERDTGLLKPGLLGALKNQLPHFCDVTAYLRIGKNGKRVLHLKGSETFLAKTRAWWLPERIVYAEDDFDVLNRLFKAIAAGPKSVSTRGANKEK